MKKNMLIGIGAIAVMLGISGCTYNDIYCNTQTFHVYEARREVPYVFRHPRYPETNHLKPFPRHQHNCKVINESCSKICEREIQRKINEINNKNRCSCPACRK